MVHVTQAVHGQPCHLYVRATAPSAVAALLLLPHSRRARAVDGPGGAGDPAPAPADPIAYMQVPYEKKEAATDEKKDVEGAPTRADVVQSGEQVNLVDRREVLGDAGDEFDERPMGRGRN